MQPSKSQIKQNFARSAKRYDVWSAMQREIIEHLLEMPLAHAPKQYPDLIRRVVDLGCGTGYALECLSKRYNHASFMGVDLAFDMLEMSHLNTPDTVLMQADIEQLPLADNMFDMVFSTSSLQWCNLTRALEEIVRIAKPGAPILLSTFIQGTLKDWRSLWQLDNASSFFLSLSKVEECCINAGLKELVISSEFKQQSFHTLQQAVDSIRQLGAAQTEHIPRGLMGKQRYRSVQSKVQEMIDQQGTINLSYHVAYITAIA